MTRVRRGHSLRLTLVPNSGSPASGLRFPVSGFRSQKVGFRAGKPDSVPHLAVLWSLFLSGRLAADPASGAACATPPAAAYPWLWDGPPSHLFCLAPNGVFRAANVTVGAVGSYPTFSPL